MRVIVQWTFDCSGKKYFPFHYLLQIVRSFLEPHLKDLEAKQWTPEKRLILGLMVSHVLVTYKVGVGSSDAELLCESLFLEPNDEQQICIGWNYIKEMHFANITR